MAAPKITNAQIIDALKLLGTIPPDAQVPTTGAQSSTFAMRLVGTQGVSYQDFARAKEFVRLFQANKAWDQKTINEVLNTTDTTGRSMYDRFIRTSEDRLTRGVTSLRGRAGPRDSSVAKARGALEGFKGAVSAFVKADEKGVPSFVPKGLDVGPRDIQGPQARPRVTTPAPTGTPPGDDGGGLGDMLGQAEAMAGQVNDDSGLFPEPAPQTPAEIRAEMEATYGWAAGLADIPEIAKILNDAYNGRISDVEADNLFKVSDYYKTTTSSERQWKILWSTDPQVAKDTYQDTIQNLSDRVGALGLDPNTIRIGQLADLVLRFGWDDTEINRYLASEMKYDPKKEKKGVFKAISDMQYDYLVPLSDQAMQAWGSAIVSGTQTMDDLTTYMKNSATSLFPALGQAFQNPEMTTRMYLDPYTKDIANTLGVHEEDINWMDPKYQRFINQIDPKTNQRTVMSRADVIRTLRADDTYGYKDSANGKTERSQLARTIIEDFGLRPTSGASFR